MDDTHFGFIVALVFTGHPILGVLLFIAVEGFDHISVMYAVLSLLEY